MKHAHIFIAKYTIYSHLLLHKATRLIHLITVMTDNIKTKYLNKYAPL